jgi:hypothetical protein
VPDDDELDPPRSLQVKETSSRSQDQTCPRLLEVLMQQCPDMIEDCSAITVSALFIGLELRINRPIPPFPQGLQLSRHLFAASLLHFLFPR